MLFKWIVVNMYYISMFINTFIIPIYVGLNLARRYYGTKPTKALIVCHIHCGILLTILFPIETTISYELPTDLWIGFTYYVDYTILLWFFVFIAFCITWYFELHIKYYDFETEDRRDLLLSPSKKTFVLSSKNSGLQVVSDLDPSRQDEQASKKKVPSIKAKTRKILKSIIFLTTILFIVIISHL